MWEKWGLIMHADDNAGNRGKRWCIGREKLRNLTIDQMKGLLWTVKMNLTMGSAPRTLTSWVIK